MGEHGRVERLVPDVALGHGDAQQRCGRGELRAGARCPGLWVRALLKPYTLHPQTLHPTPSNRTPYTLKTYTLHPQTLHPTPSNSTPYTLPPPCPLPAPSLPLPCPLVAFPSLSV